MPEVSRKVSGPALYAQISETLIDHPKTTRAIRLLKVNRLQFIGHLACLWNWALKNAPNGDLSRYSARDIADAARFTDPDDWEDEADQEAQRFLAALIECRTREDGAGFLERVDGVLLIHDWEQFGGRLNRARDKNAFRQWRLRWRGKGINASESEENWQRYHDDCPPVEADETTHSDEEPSGEALVPSSKSRKALRHAYVTRTKRTGEERREAERSEADRNDSPLPQPLSAIETDRQTLVGDLHPARVCEEPGRDAVDPPPVRVPPAQAPLPPQAPLSVGRSVGLSRLSAGEGQPPGEGASAGAEPTCRHEVATGADPPLDPETAAEVWCRGQLARCPELATRVREAREKAQKAGTTIRHPWQWQRGVIEQVQREQAERRARAAESPQAARDKAAEQRIIRTPKLTTPRPKPPERDPSAPFHGDLIAARDGLLPDPMEGLSPMERLAWLQRQEDQIAAHKAVPVLTVVGGRT